MYRFRHLAVLLGWAALVGGCDDSELHDAESPSTILASVVARRNLNGNRVAWFLDGDGNQRRLRPRVRDELLSALMSRSSLSSAQVAELSAASDCTATVPKPTVRDVQELLLEAQDGEIIEYSQTCADCGAPKTWSGFVLDPDSHRQKPFLLYRTQGSRRRAENLSAAGRALTRWLLSIAPNEE